MSPSRDMRVVLWVLLFCGWSCKPEASTPESNRVEAKFGLFFGGQIQQRLELPFELDSSRQAQGFQLMFREPVKRPTQLEWTLDYPTTRAGPRGPSNAPRAARIERATLPIGADRFEQSLVLRPTDVPGTYNIRVLVDGEIVMDRPFLLVEHRLDRDD